MSKIDRHAEYTMFFFQLDNCPVHTARIVQRWFAEQRDIDLLEWPSKGCDMNPIENCWGNIVNSWIPGEERSSRQLLQHTKVEWERFRRRQEVIYDTVASMRDRLQKVIANGGGWNGY